MKTVLVIDDVRNFPPSEEDEIITARTAEEGLVYLQDKFKQGLDELWLDFDLGFVFGRLELFNTAMPVALWLAEEAFYGHPHPVETIYIHSANPVGSEAMRLTLERYGYNVHQVEAHFGI